jgi:hypothetical protein
MMNRGSLIQGCGEAVETRISPVSQMIEFAIEVRGVGCS